MMKQQLFGKTILVAVLFFIVITQQSCVDEYSDFDKLKTEVDYSPAIAGAVAHTKLTVKDIIRDYDDDELFTEDETGFLYLMYNKKVFTKNVESLIQFPDQDFPTADYFNKTAYDAITPSGGYRQFPILDSLYHFSLDNNEQLDSIQYDAIDIQIEVNSSFHLNGNLKITFPALMKNGVPFQQDITPDATGSFHFDLTTHLEDYCLVFDVNKVLVSFDLRLEDNPGVVNNGDELTITIKMKNQDFKGIFGYIGRINTIIPQDTVNISIFDNAFDGSVYFEDPSMTLTINNSIGLPVRSYFGNLQTYSTIQNGSGGQGVWETHAFPLDSLNVNFPNTIGETTTQTEVLDVNNFPAIRDVIATQPQFLFFEVDSVTLNPDGYDATHPNFVLDSSKVDVDLEVKLPLWGNALYSLVDTIQLDIEENFEDISKHFVEANLRTIFDNFLPTNVYAQVIFTDSLYQPLVTLFNEATIGERLIESAILDNNGRAKQSVKKTTDILFGNGPEYDHDINDLERVKHAIIIGTLKTNEAGGTGIASPLVKFYSDNYLEVKFGVKGQGKYEGQVE